MGEGFYRCYVSKKFTEDHLILIRHADVIIKEYEQQGLALTLRQLYYQFVARGLLPNTVHNYNRLGGIVSDARLAGLLSWVAIEDRTRNLMGLHTYVSPAAAVKIVAADYRIDAWADQPFRPEVWIEKEALTGVIGSICNQLRVDFFACKGYNSQSEQWRAGRRMAKYVSKGQRPIVFHLGDHDPSGIDMTRDNQERLSLFAGVPIQVQRIALSMPQVEDLQPPPNPAKMTDSRYGTYREQFGEESWELDALSPSYIRDLINGAISAIRDDERWDQMMRQEAEDRQALQDVAADMNGEIGRAHV